MSCQLSHITLPSHLLASLTLKVGNTLLCDSAKGCSCESASLGSMLVTNMNRIPTYVWCLIKCGPKNGHHRDMHLKQS